jgi:Rrf2 family transcriptional regulator, iron-sulfur cluster assembly transcription factor
LRILLALMLFSKSFGYALRSVLYLASVGEGTSRIALDEIADVLKVPRHFLGKVMKRLVKEGVLSSQKGPSGGFSMNEKTLNLTLYDFLLLSGETTQFESCILRLNRCNSQNPCPMHDKAEFVRNEWQRVLSSTMIKDLLKVNQAEFIQSLRVHA